MHNSQFVGYIGYICVVYISLLIQYYRVCGFYQNCLDSVATKKEATETRFPSG
jgi:hypothetical protein